MSQATLPVPAHTLDAICSAVTAWLLESAAVRRRVATAKPAGGAETRRRPDFTVARRVAKPRGGA